MRRLLYRRELGDDGTKTIFRSLFYFDPEGGEWLDFEAARDRPNPTSRPREEEELDPQIRAIPVYHIRSNPTADKPFGSSEVRGIERLFAANHRGISDEELSLALDGLGMYATEGGPTPGRGRERATGVAPGPGGEGRDRS